MRRRFMNNNGINIDNYFTVEPTVGGFTASLSNYCEYCVNGDGKWKKLPANTETEKIPAGHTLSFKRIGATAGKFSFNGRCNVKGNIMSLLFGDAAAENISLVGYPKAFSNLFYGNNIIDASELILPATTLADSCYSHMFYNCQFLMNAPELPATTLADSCYYNMFYGTNVFPDCNNIDFVSSDVVVSGGLKGLFAGTDITDSDLEKILPKNINGRYCLPVTTLADYCYRNMFYGCSRLTTAPELPATTLTNSCYWDMFYGCSSITTAPELPATTLAKYCYYGMFNGCSRLTTAPELPATTLTSYCYAHMFAGCTSLTTTPTLPATSLADGCYEYMFNGCSKLNYIKMLATDISAYICLSNWVSGVSSTGTFVKNPNMMTLPTGVSGIPSGWTVVNDGNLITFTVNGTVYQAEEGMTFYDWALSEYYDSSCLLNLGITGNTSLRDDIINGNISSDDSITIVYGGGATITPGIYTNTIIQPISYIANVGGWD